jgi:hypothetical protein
VDGVAGREAVALAAAVLDGLRRHRWQGDEGPAGPAHLPPPAGTLFPPPDRQAA